MPLFWCVWCIVSCFFVLWWNQILCFTKSVIFDQLSVSHDRFLCIIVVILLKLWLINICMLFKSWHGTSFPIGLNKSVSACRKSKVLCYNTSQIFQIHRHILAVWSDQCCLFGPQIEYCGFGQFDLCKWIYVSRKVCCQGSLYSYTW